MKKYLIPAIELLSKRIALYSDNYITREEASEIIIFEVNNLEELPYYLVNMDYIAFCSDTVIEDSLEDLSYEITFSLELASDRFLVYE